ILILAQAWIIDTVIIDSDRKKIRVLIRSFNKQVDKGEYDIDDKLKITIKIRHAQYGDLHQLGIKYGRKTIWGQSDSPVAGAAGWNYAMFLKVAETVEQVRGTQR
ncbi:MAG TPA: hypothetical protein VN922_06655, partial [Bacteroidia bacterium]|nr:hypothetical protein [Bacteroidia bacterium]